MSKIDPMPALTRKQREIAERHQLFLDIAKEVIQDDGCSALSMDRLAEIAEYSRGTVYQHFPCKEEVLIQVCNHALSHLLSLFERAKALPCKSRDRMLALIVAHDHFSQAHSYCIKIKQFTSDNSIIDKVSDTSCQKHDELQASLIDVVASIVSDAITNNELTLPDNIGEIEIVYGFWSLSEGSQQLQDCEVPLESLGITSPTDTSTRMAAMMLDGLNWQPLYEAVKHQQLMEWLHNTVFNGDDDQHAT